MQKDRSRDAEPPDPRVRLELRPGRITVHFDGEILADSERALVVREPGHDPVVYFPRADVRTERLLRTDRTSFCPRKGHACYWTIRGADREASNAVWSYEDPFAEVAGLANFMAFYADRVEWGDGS